MPDRSFLHWPFFEPRHRALAEDLEGWAARELGGMEHGNVDAACRVLAGALGRGGWLEHAAVDPGDERSRLDVRMLCLIREILARHEGLADFVFAMQGLGTGAIQLFGTGAQKETWLPEVRAGRAIAAFALTESASGSDVANLATSARRDGTGWVIDGEKTWISNGGIADFYCLFARMGEPGAGGLSAFLVPGVTAGLEIRERLETIAPHPLARLCFHGMKLPREALIGSPGQGFRIAMTVLDVFRSTVAAAALGFARRALDESLERVGRRHLFGKTMAELQMVQGHVADMALAVDAAALLVYRAAWTRDSGSERVSREAAMAKLHATEHAQKVIDTAVQLHGADGVRSGAVVERLYREIRSLRIYEGASDVQRVIIARQALGG